MSWGGPLPTNNNEESQMLSARVSKRREKDERMCRSKSPPSMDIPRSSRGPCHKEMKAVESSLSPGGYLLRTG